MRSVNFGANSITQEFCKESGLEWQQAEEYKQAYGYVHLTNTEEPADPYQAILVRTARNVMTRLHQQVAQTGSTIAPNRAGNHAANLSRGRWGFHDLHGRIFHGEIQSAY